MEMCEFNVVFEGKIVFKDVIYARASGSKVIIKDILGESKEFENSRIAEVDVNSVRLVLAPLKSEK